MPQSPLGKLLGEKVNTHPSYSPSPPIHHLFNLILFSGKKYCDGCRCFDCDTPLTNGFYEEGNLRFCDPCNHKHEEDLKKPPSTFISLFPPTTSSPLSHSSALIATSPSSCFLPHHRSSSLNHYSLLTSLTEHTHDHSEHNLGMGKKPPHTHDHGSQDLKGKPPTHDHSNHDLKGRPHTHAHDHNEHDLKGAPKGGCRACGKSTAGKPHKAGDRDDFCPPHENGILFLFFSLCFYLYLFHSIY